MTSPVSLMTPLCKFYFTPPVPVKILDTLIHNAIKSPKFLLYPMFLLDPHLVIPLHPHFAAYIP